MRERTSWASESTTAPGPEKRSFAEIFSFGEQLIQTGDLDPVYIAIYDAELDPGQLRRLLLAYWCFYHLGAAAYISEFKGADYWATMVEAAVNKDLWCPRGAERRHFRGEKCVKAVKWLEANYLGIAPEQIVDELYEPNASDVMKRITRWPMFGPWIAFKAADMIDRLIAPVMFSVDIAWLYSEPRAGLDMLPDYPQGATYQLLARFSKYKAPPKYERCCSIQEVESVLCKFKAFVNGHYWIGKDVHEVRKGLVGWGKTAERLLQAAPNQVEDGRLFR